MACATCRDGSSGPTRGKHSLRDLIRGAVALGLAAGSTGTLHTGGVTPVAAQETHRRGWIVVRNCPLRRARHPSPSARHTMPRLWLTATPLLHTLLTSNE